MQVEVEKAERAAKRLRGWLELSTAFSVREIKIEIKTPGSWGALAKTQGFLSLEPWRTNCENMTLEIDKALQSAKSSLGTSQSESLNPGNWQFLTAKRSTNIRLSAFSWGQKHKNRRSGLLRLPGLEGLRSRNKATLR